jgi:streptogramin lyase
VPGESGSARLAVELRVLLSSWLGSTLARVGFLGLVTLACVLGSLCIATPVGATQYSDPRICNSDGISAGPSGEQAVWFANACDGSIDRMTTAGEITNTYSGAQINAFYLTPGPAGEEAMWFTNHNSIGRINIKTGEITIYNDPTIYYADGITDGPNGEHALWFSTMESNGKGAAIGRISTETGEITKYTSPNLWAPGPITVGSDGALWFVDQIGSSFGGAAGMIGRVNPATGEITEFHNPDPHIVAYPYGITAGPDGALWYANLGTVDGVGETIGRITTSGEFSYFSDPSIKGPKLITGGPEGAMWFGADGGIGRITTDGTMTYYTEAGLETPWQVSNGPDGAMWFTQKGSVGSTGGASVFARPLSTLATETLTHFVGRVEASAIPVKVSPDNGGIAGGTSVRIAGAVDFTGASAVDFGSKPATSFTVDSKDSITAVAPAGTGTVDVTVTTPAGTTPTGPADRFSYCPCVSSVKPNAGPLGGGTEVSIGGAGFTNVSAVKFGGNNATSYNVNSPTSITAFSPPGTGTVDVTVTNSEGTSTLTPADQFAYLPAPTVTKVKPNKAPAGEESKEGGGGGTPTTITITGTNFKRVSAVNIGSTLAKSYTVSSETSIVAVVAPQAAGTVDVRVTTPAGTSAISSADKFKFYPTIAGVTPSTGSRSGGTPVTIKGSGFGLGTKATVLKFGTAKGLSVNCGSSTECTAVTPAHAAGTVDVTATVNKVNSPKVAADRFTYS